MMTSCQGIHCEITVIIAFQHAPCPNRTMEKVDEDHNLRMFEHTNVRRVTIGGVSYNIPTLRGNSAKSDHNRRYRLH